MIELKEWVFLRCSEAIVSLMSDLSYDCELGNRYKYYCAIELLFVWRIPTCTENEFINYFYTNDELYKVANFIADHLESFSLLIVCYVTIYCLCRYLTYHLWLYAVYSVQSVEKNSLP